MTARTFTQDDQSAFAALSGDFNPLHVDPVAARRLMFGAPAVHGVHTLLWALDRWAAETGQGPFILTSVKATFAKPVRVGDTVRFEIRKASDGKARLAVVGPDGGVVVRADIAWTDGPAEGAAPEARRFAPADPVEPAAYEDLSGDLVPAFDPVLGAELLPCLTKAGSSAQIAALLAATRLVGMEAPGLHSVFSSLEIAFTGPPQAAPIRWRVVQADMRFSLLNLALDAPGLAGQIAAFVRPSPRRQAGFAELRTRVEPGAFAGQRALVVGGSRGLGEVAAKLLAAGGAEVMATWARGADDARALVEDIRAGGGAAETGRVDVLTGEMDEHVAAWAPTHLYYFATPFIQTGPAGGFSQPLFETFSRYYCGGLLALAKRFEGSLKGVFSPSSVFVEETPDALVEYAGAKAAAEFACADLARRRPGWKVAWPRLPKLGTDQTTALNEPEADDPTPVMLDALLAFSRTG